MSQVPTATTANYPDRTVCGVAKLWVDGVGAFLVCFDSQVRIGGAGSTPGAKPEIALMSNLSRSHLRIVRSGEVWLVEPLGPTSIDERPIARPSLLNDGNLLRLGTTVKLRFRLPSVLSGTACLEFESSHRPNPSVDGIILFAEMCVLSSKLDAHISLREGSDTVILTRRSNGLWCQAREGVSVEGVAQEAEVRCEIGKVYSGPNWRFRLEAVV